MADELLIQSFAEERSWVYNQDRTRAAIWYDTGHPRDAFGTGTDLFVEVWDVATKQRLAHYWLAHTVNPETGEDDGPQVCGVAFTKDGRTLIIRYTDGSEQRVTFPFHPAEAPAITAYVEGLHESLTDEQIARVESIDTSGTGDPTGFPGHLRHEFGRQLAYFLADVACRRFAPLALDAAGQPDLANELRTMTPIASESTAKDAREACEALRDRFDQAPLTYVLSYVLHDATSAARVAAEGDFSTGGGHAGRAAANAQEVVGAGTDVTDAGIHLIPELVALAHELHRSENLQVLLKRAHTFGELDALARAYPSEDAQRLIKAKKQEMYAPLVERMERARVQMRRAREEGKSKLSAFERRVKEVQERSKPKGLP